MREDLLHLPMTVNLSAESRSLLSSMHIEPESNYLIRGSSGSTRAMQPALSRAIGILQIP